MAYLTLEDGSVFEGKAFGAPANTVGEIVFNTGMTGYQEVLTDPSYCGQIVTMTYPLIGNYGINNDDVAGQQPKIAALVVRELCDEPSNWRCEGSVEEYLIKHGIPGIQGVDTRALTRKLREHGTMRAMITEQLPTQADIDKMMKHSFSNPVERVTCEKAYEMGEGNINIAVIDLGAKAGILNSLIARENVKISVFPADISAETILQGKFDAVVISNGPGDPKDNPKVIENVKENSMGNFLCSEYVSVI